MLDPLPFSAGHSKLEKSIFKTEPGEREGGREGGKKNKQRPKELCKLRGLVCVMSYSSVWKAKVSAKKYKRKKKGIKREYGTCHSTRWIWHQTSLPDIPTPHSIRNKWERWGGAMLPAFHLIKAIRIHLVKCCRVTFNLTSPTSICICLISTSWNAVEWMGTLDIIVSWFNDQIWIKVIRF